ncbi:MAG: tetratricopeptide repeat protein [Proteobacteria bacterium]|nr:tetratricopeptide repeat protein [Pseudomonadota bacterium]MDA1308316.1 tetratricopeptide repeat protein [Pseudomonadota bacterium]
MSRAEKRRQQRANAGKTGVGKTGVGEPGTGQTSAARTPVVSDPRSLRHEEMSRTAMRRYMEGDAEAAKALWTAVLHEDEEYPDALHGMGVIARDMGRYEVGAELMRRALLKDLTNAPMYSNLGTLFERWERYDDAIAAYKTGLRHAPRDQILYNNLGSCLAHMGQRGEALRAFKKALDLGGESLDLLTNYAVTLADVGQFARAEPYFLKVLEKRPEPSPFHFSYGTQLLKQGRWAEGWRLYERRLLKLDARVLERRYPQPHWTGDPAVESLLLGGEQGIGDEIRYASMIPDVLRAVENVTVECEPRLVDLFQRSFPAARVLPGPYGDGESRAVNCAASVPMGSLGGLFRGSPEAFPRHTGYLTPDPERRQDFAARLAEHGDGPFVGVCWRSGLQRAFRNEYYASVTELGPLLKTEGSRFVNLQYDARDEEFAEAKSRFGADLLRWDDLDLKDDLDGAAALTACLDMVVSPATSVSCMAGALGVPTREFRPSLVPQGHLIDGTCPWFPSLRFIDKRAGEAWTKVFGEISRELRGLVAAREEG